MQEQDLGLAKENLMSLFEIGLVGFEGGDFVQGQSELR